MDGASFIADEHFRSQLWRAVPVVFEYESIAPISRRPLSRTGVASCFKTAIKHSVVHPTLTKIKTEFKGAACEFAAAIKDKYGHASMMLRRNGEVRPIYEDMEIAGFLPEIMQRRKNADGKIAYCNVADEKEMWHQLIHWHSGESERLRFWRRTFPGALSDDENTMPRTALVARLTKDMFDAAPAEIRRQTEGQPYHSIGKNAPNCLTTWFNVLDALGADVPKELRKYRVPQELNWDIRNRKLVDALAGCNSFVIIEREEMAEAIRTFKGVPFQRQLPLPECRFAA